MQLLQYLLLIPSDEVSDKYTHIPTEKVIDDMQLLGWGVVEAKGS